LLIYYVNPDNQKDFPVEDLDAEEPTSVVSTPQQRIEYAAPVNSVLPTSVVNTPESGSLIHEMEKTNLSPVTVNSSSVNGQRSAVSSSDKTDNHTGETPVPPTSNDNSSDNDQSSGEQSPDPSGTDEYSVNQLMGSWQHHTKKRASAADFRLLLQESGDEWLFIDLVQSWMFERSDFWAKESPAWETGPKEFDISSSRAFYTNYAKIRDSRNSFYEQIAATAARRKQKQADDSGKTEAINALRENVERQRIARELEETFDDDDFPSASEHRSITYADDEQAGTAKPPSDDVDNPVKYHPDVTYLAGRWKEWFHNEVDLALVDKWRHSWGSKILLRSFRFVAMDPAWEKAIPDAVKFDMHIGEIIETSDPNAPDWPPPPEDYEEF